jgi:oxygen-independent coproporphyrinogen-3 oxidase
MEVLTLGQRVNEAITFGLRMLEGVSRTRLIQRFGTDPWIFKEGDLTHLVTQGLIEDDSRTIRLTSRGLALADSVAVTLS